MLKQCMFDMDLLTKLRYFELTMRDIQKIYEMLNFYNFSQIKLI